MRMYVVSLAVGLLVGIVYGLLDVRSPAPPVVALIGLLGMLIGEQVVPAAKRLISGQPITAAWMKTECVPHVFGELPTRPEAGAQSKSSIENLNHS
jgi:XapX domain-containing protein